MVVNRTGLIDLTIETLKRRSVVVLHIDKREDVTIAYVIARYDPN